MDPRQTKISKNSMERNIDCLTQKIFQNQDKINIELLKNLKKDMTEEIIQFKFHSLSSDQLALSPEEFCKSMFSSLHPTDARKKIHKIDDLLERGRVKGRTDYEDFRLIQRFFNEYKKYFKLNKTSNFSREKFKQVFDDFSNDYELSLNNEWALDNLFNLIDFDENENLLH